MYESSHLAEHSTICTAQKATIQQVATMLAILKMVYFQVITTC